MRSCPQCGRALHESTHYISPEGRNYHARYCNTCEKVFVDVGGGKTITFEYPIWNNVLVTNKWKLIEAKLRGVPYHGH